MRWLSRRRHESERPPDADVYRDLRGQVLGLTPDRIGVGDVPIVALLMETGYPEAVATLVAVADGSSSLYFSNGGGIIGAGEHESVAEAAGRWLETGNTFLLRLHQIADPPLPAVGETQFIAVTRDGLRRAAAPEEALGEGEHALSPLFYAGQDVITQIRLIDEAR